MVTGSGAYQATSAKMLANVPPSDSLRKVQDDENDNDDNVEDEGRQHRDAGRRGGVGRVRGGGGDGDEEVEEGGKSQIKDRANSRRRGRCCSWLSESCLS
jgi:hypothetical protein